MKLIDLSVAVPAGVNLLYPGSKYLEIKPIINYSNNLMLSSNVEMWLHAGTHVDAPFHVYKEGSRIENVELPSLVHEAVVLNLVGSLKEGCEITAPMLADAERRLGAATLHEGDIIILRTDWILSRPPWTAEYRDRAPYLTLDAANWLESKKPSAVGFDFPEERVTKLKESLSKKTTEHPLPVHRKLLGAGIYLVEHLTNLNRISSQRFLFAAAPVKLVGAEGAPARAFAVE